MAPTNGVVSRKSRASTPPPQEDASGNVQRPAAYYQEPLKKPDVKSGDVKGPANSSVTGSPPQKSRSFKCSCCMFMVGLLVSVASASLTTVLIILKPHLVSALEKTYGPEHPRVAIGFNNMVDLLQAQGKLQEALPMYKGALEINEKTYGPEHPEVAKNLNNMAVLLEAQGKLQEALPMYKRALEIKEKTYGPELNKKAELLQAEGKLQEALPMYKGALEINEKTYGPEHPEVAKNLNNMAMLLKAQGKLQEALPMYKRALEINKKSYGPEHLSVAAGLNNIAMYKLERVGNSTLEIELDAHIVLKSALLVYKGVVEINEKTFGPEHPEVTKNLNGMAMLFKVQGKLQEALSMYKRALEIAKKACGIDQVVFTAQQQSALRLDSLREAQSKLKEALSMLKHEVQVLQQTYGPEHPQVASCLQGSTSWLDSLQLVHLGASEPAQ